MAFRLIVRQLTQHQQQYHSSTTAARCLLQSRCFSSVFKLEMPSLSPTMTDGNIVQWIKKEGDLVKVGDVVCEIQTDKATMGFESQEEGYLAKILVPKDSKNVEIGKLIGILVEDKADIATLDLSKFAQKAAVAPVLNKKESADAPQAALVATPSSETQAALTPADFVNQYYKEEHIFKIAPSAGYYLKTFHVLPSEVKATGTKKYIQKSDVLGFITSNFLQKGVPRKQAAAPAKEAAKPSQTALQKPAKPAAKGASDGTFDKNNLFKQSWADVPAEKTLGDAIQSAKKYQAHTYMSAYVTIESALKNLSQFDSKLPIDSYISRAATKAFSKVFKHQGVNVARVAVNGNISFVEKAETLNVAQFTKATSEQKKGSAFTTPAQLVIHSLQTAVVEALPINTPESLITLHFTQPHADVVYDGEEQFFDVSTIGDKPLNYDLKAKKANRVKLSISFDAGRVDEIQAVRYLSKLQTYLNDPETMLL